MGLFFPVLSRVSFHTRSIVFQVPVIFQFLLVLFRQLPHASRKIIFFRFSILFSVPLVSLRHASGYRIGYIRMLLQVPLSANITIIDIQFLYSTFIGQLEFILLSIPLISF